MHLYSFVQSPSLQAFFSICEKQAGSGDCKLPHMYKVGSGDWERGYAYTDLPAGCIQSAHSSIQLLLTFPVPVCLSACLSVYTYHGHYDTLLHFYVMSTVEAAGSL